MIEKKERGTTAALSLSPLTKEGEKGAFTSRRRALQAERGSKRRIVHQENA